MSGPTIVPEGAVAIPVGPYTALVDESDAELVGGYRWFPDESARTGKIYAKSRCGRTQVWMHRLIAGTPKGLDTDHRDGNGLNNCRSNLRPATRSQNNVNRRKHSSHAGKPTTSQFKGVHWDSEKRKWRAAIKVGGRQIRLGRFDDEVEAARAYDRALVAQWGEYAQVNFPDEVAS